MDYNKMIQKELKDTLRTAPQYSFILGKEDSGNVVISNLNINPTLFIAGETGGGSLPFLLTTLTSLMMNNSPENLKILLVDPNKVEFNLLQNCPHIVNNTIVSSPEETLLFLQKYEKETNYRCELFNKQGVDNIDTYNKLSKNKLSRVVIAINEYKHFMLSDSIKDSFYKSIVKLSKNAGKIGVHLLIKTERVSQTTIPSIWRLHFPSVVCFNLDDNAKSNLVLGESGAEQLDITSELLYKNTYTKQPTQKLQSVMICSTDTFKTILSQIK